MSIIFCPECGHEVSANAVACPNCGRPMDSVPVPVVEENVVVARPRRKEGFPTWAYVPIGLLAVILLLVVYIAMRESSDSSNTNVNVNLAGRRGSTADTPDTRTATTTTVPPTDSTSVTVPGQTTTVPGQTTTVPGTSTSVPAPPPSKGTVVIKARIVPSRGSVQAARGTKFYLLDEDLESILSDARVEPIEGNTLMASIGLAAVYPDRYGDFQRAAQRAIAAHVKYSGTTSSDGTASLSGVEPREYYLFGIARVGRGFALWSSPVSVVPGENLMNLSPQSVTEIPSDSGD